MKSRLKIFIRAQSIAQTIGVRAAAGYLRNRDVSFEAALWLLAGAAPRSNHGEFHV
jgi:hypothetical protein